MGGDFGPRVTVPATFDVLRAQPQLKVVLLGDEKQIFHQLPTDYDSFRQRAFIRHCDQIVTMDEQPSKAVRHKRNSSMWQAIALVSKGEATAAISAGNTGALMALSLLQLGTLPGIDRPAICTKIPTSNGYTYLLDMGANLTCTPLQLYQFALMANQVAQSAGGIACPRIGLLNIGVEVGKGHSEIHQAADLLEENPLINYIGYVEGDRLFSGNADIVVCDGFSGNILLKTAEGAVTLFSNDLKKVLGKSISGRIAGFLARSSLRELRRKLSPSIYNGASLLGLQGVVVKSHGGADRSSFGYAIEAARQGASLNIPSLIGTTLVNA